MAFPLRTTIDGKAAWAICDKVTTVAVSRLTPDKAGIRRLPEDEFHEMLTMVLGLLPKLPATREPEPEPEPEVKPEGRGDPSA